jgi:benzoyl-CoA reductase/2-hydroxyglutaryl-CoA dehydratase subunit BcrC/BadD/HgdB
MTDLDNFNMDEVSVDDIKNKPYWDIAPLIIDDHKRQYLLDYKEQYEAGQEKHYNKNKKANKYYNSETYVEITEQELSKTLQKQNKTVKIWLKEITLD